jgi:hypothetical protein
MISTVAGGDASLTVYDEDPSTRPPHLYGTRDLGVLG